MCRLTRILVILVLISRNHYAIAFVAGGVIWSRNLGNFISIANVSTFAAERQHFLSRSRALEIHNFENEVLKLAYYEEKNIIVFYENDTKITGVCGEVWNMLSEYLNFKLVTIKVDSHHFGTRMENGSYDGILGMMQRKEIQIIPRTGFYVAESQVMDFTTPIWNNKYRLYIRRELKSDSAWMFKMFDRTVCYLMLIMFLGLSGLGYTIQKISSKVSRDKQLGHSLQDHFFYTFGTLCSQGFIPDSLYHRIKIFGLTKKLFAWLFLVIISSHLISYMTNRKFEPPFEDLKTLFKTTQYNLIVFKGMLVFDKFKRTTSALENNLKYQKRFIYVDTTQTMYDMACQGTETYAIFQSSDRQRAFGRYACSLVPTGKVYFPTWVTAGISKNFKYKRTLDIGILKLNEFGLTDAMQDRWMVAPQVINKKKPFASVNFNQVSMLFVMLCMGLVASLIIFIIENIVYVYKSNNRRIIHSKPLKFRKRTRGK